jgi:hypothetical protein
VHLMDINAIYSIITKLICLYIKLKINLSFETNETLIYNFIIIVIKLIINITNIIEFIDIAIFYQTMCNVLS